MIEPGDQAKIHPLTHQHPGWRKEEALGRGGGGMMGWRWGTNGQLVGGTVRLISLITGQHHRPPSSSSVAKGAEGWSTEPDVGLQLPAPLLDGLRAAVRAQEPVAGAFVVRGEGDTVDSPEPAANTLTFVFETK